MAVESAKNLINCDREDQRQGLNCIIASIMMMMVRAHLIFFNFFINGGSIISPYSGSVQEFVDL